MRYTRYNYKPPKKKNNFMIIFILIIIAAIALGTIFSKLLPKNNTANAVGKDKTTSINLPKDSKKGKDGVDTSKTVPSSGIKDYVAIQCGAFSSKEKALILKNSLAPFGTPFIIEEDKLVRVLFGIYPKENVEVVTKQLEVNKIKFVKINFQIIGNDQTSAQMNEMISADIKILNELSKKDTKGYGTVLFKKWLNDLKGANEKSASYKSMTQLKVYLTALPAEFKKEKAEEGYMYIYKFIKTQATK